MATEQVTNPYEIAWDVLERLERVQQGVEKLHKQEEQFRWRNAANVATALTTLSFTFPSSQAQRPGYDFVLERVAATAARAGALDIYLDNIDPLNLVESITLPAVGPDGRSKFTDAFSNNIWVPDGSVVVANFTGMLAADYCTLSIQGKRVGLPPKTAHYQVVTED